MSIGEKLTQEAWNHSQGDHEIERLALEYKISAEQMAIYALRFISMNGLSEEFAAAVNEAEAALEEATSISM